MRENYPNVKAYDAPTFAKLIRETKREAAWSEVVSFVGLIFIMFGGGCLFRDLPIWIWAPLIIVGVVLARWFGQTVGEHQERVQWLTAMVLSNAKPGQVRVSKIPLNGCDRRPFGYDPAMIHVDDNGFPWEPRQGRWVSAEWPPPDADAGPDSELPDWLFADDPKGGAELAPRTVIRVNGGAYHAEEYGDQLYRDDDGHDWHSDGWTWSRAIPPRHHEGNPQ